MKKLALFLLLGLLGYWQVGLAVDENAAPYTWQTPNTHTEFHMFDQMDAYSLQSNYLDNRDAINLRRVQLGLDGSFYHNFVYSAWYSVNYNTWRNLYVGYLFGDVARFRAGQFYLPVGLNNRVMKSNLNTPERPAPIQAVEPMYVRGITFDAHYGVAGMALAVFGPPFKSGHPVSRPYSFASRWYLAPVHNAKDAFHIGLSTWRIQQPTQMITVRSYPEVILSSWDTNDTVIQSNMFKNVNYTQTTDLELASFYKQFTLMSEYLVTEVNRNDTSVNPNQYYDGYYVNLGYFLTGESQPYRFRIGGFNGISPIRHSYGAIQFVSQFSELDLNSHQNLMSHHGGRQNTWTYGVNYFPTKRWKFSLDYIDARATGASLLPYPRQVRTCLLRAQFFI